MKKELIYLIMVLLISCGISACKKSKVVPLASTSLTIVNAISGSDALVPSFAAGVKPVIFTGTINSGAPVQQIPANGYTEFAGYLNNTSVSFAQVSDTSHIIFAHSVALEPGSIHSLFLTGTLSSPDFLFTTDNISAIKDSSINARFVNLSTGSKPVSINVQETPNTPIVSSLPYKGITDFENFSAKEAMVPPSRYTFEIRDQAAGNVLATFTLLPLVPNLNQDGFIPGPGLAFKSVTVAFIGTPDDGSGNGTQQAILINNY